MIHRSKNRADHPAPGTNKSPPLWPGTQGLDPERAGVKKSISRILGPSAARYDTRTWRAHAKSRRSLVVGRDKRNDHTNEIPGHSGRPDRLADWRRSRRARLRSLRLLYAATRNFSPGP